MLSWQVKMMISKEMFKKKKNERKIVNKSTVFQFEFFSKHFGPAFRSISQKPRSLFKIIETLILSANTANIKQLSGLKSYRDFRAPGACFSKVLVTFSAGKAILCCRFFSQDENFNNFENDTMKLSVNEEKLTGLWARNWTTIQQVLILKFAFGP